jgi:hypothetical protein
MITKTMDDSELKSILLSVDTIRVDPQAFYSDTYNLANQKYIFLRIGPYTRVKVRTDSDSPIILVRNVNGNTLLYKDQEIATGVEIETPIYHCPHQVSVCLYYECGMGCKFCPLPSIGGKLHPDEAGILEIIKENLALIKGVAFTHAIPLHRNTRDIINEIVKIVGKVRMLVGSNLPIGVGPFACDEETLKTLFHAGATEVRINLETFNPTLFNYLCPRKDQLSLYESLSSSVKIFGINQVSSNLIVGIGESNQDIVNGIEKLAQLGVVATLHPFDPFPNYVKKLGRYMDNVIGRPSHMRLLELAYSHKEILSKYGLSTLCFHTTCPGCNACGLAPFIDL